MSYIAARSYLNFSSEIAGKHVISPAHVRFSETGSIKKHVASSCTSVVLSSAPKPPRSATSPWDGIERRVQHFAVSKNRRKGYFASTPDFAAQAEKARARIMSPFEQWKDLQFSLAAENWLAVQSSYTEASTINCYRDYLKRLNPYFGGMLLKDIHIGHIQEYQAAMKARYKPGSVNHDTNLLSQILRKAHLWEPIKEHFRPLKKPDVEGPKVLSEVEEIKFFEFASKHDGTWLAYWVASFTNQTTASGKELRMLQLKDVHMEAEVPYIVVPHNMKTKNRPRLIPLNARGQEMMRRLLNRAGRCGSTRPEHYLFPFRHKNRRFDPSRPATQSWLKWQWSKLIDAAMEAKVISFRVKPHNLRALAITRMIENGVHMDIVQELAGHGVKSLVTRQAYLRPRVGILKAAVDAINPNQPQPPKPTKVITFKAKGANHAS